MYTVWAGHGLQEACHHEKVSMFILEVVTGFRRQIQNRTIHSISRKCFFCRVLYMGDLLHPGRLCSASKLRVSEITFSRQSDHN